MRWSARGAARADRNWLEQQLGPELEVAVHEREAHAGLLPRDERDAKVDRTLAVSCATVALRRHCGRQYWEFRRNEPPRLMQTGPDLRDVGLVVGTGGVLALGRDGRMILQAAISRIRTSEDLMTPVSRRLAIDRHYVLAAAGLLATRDPGLAWRLLESEFSSETGAGSAGQYV